MTIRRIELDKDGISVATATRIEPRHARSKSYVNSACTQTALARTGNEFEGADVNQLEQDT